MHELSVALSILDAVAEAARDEGIDRVAAVRVRIGALSGIARDALLFAWDLAAEETVAAGSELRIEDVPLVVRCDRCGLESRPRAGSGLVCERCGSLGPTIVQGRDLELVDLEVAA